MSEEQWEQFDCSICGKGPTSAKIGSLCHRYKVCSTCARKQSSIPERIPDQPEEKPRYVLEIYQGVITRDSFEQMGAMIEEGYSSGVDFPAGMFWTLWFKKEEDENE